MPPRHNSQLSQSKSNPPRSGQFATTVRKRRTRGVLPIVLQGSRHLLHRALRSISTIMLERSGLPVARQAGIRNPSRFRPSAAPRWGGKARPKCDSGRTGSARRLRDPTADLERGGAITEQMTQMLASCGLKAQQHQLVAYPATKTATITASCTASEVNGRARSGSSPKHRHRWRSCLAGRAAGSRRASSDRSPRRDRHGRCPARPRN